MGQVPLPVARRDINNRFGEPDKGERESHLGQADQQDHRDPRADSFGGETQKIEGSLHLKPIFILLTSFVTGNILLCSGDNGPNRIDLRMVDV